MLALLKGQSRARRSAMLLASLCLVSALAFARAQSELDARLAEISEIGRFVPQKALAMLVALEPQARAAPTATHAEFLNQLIRARRGVGQHHVALALCDELIAFGKRQNDQAAIAKGLLTKVYVTASMNDHALAHQLAWESEQVASGVADLGLRIETLITSGHATAEEGNFPVALAKLQAAAELARQTGDPIQIVMSLNALARLYSQLRDYDKGFEVLAEAEPFAGKTNPGRMALLKNTEYGLAIETNQPERGLAALLAALELERKMGADSMVATSLADLSDNYIKQRDYPKTLSYASQAIEAARRLGDRKIEAIARVNIGEAYLGMGRLDEGKRSFEAGLAWYEKSGDKPNLQVLMAEYGAALEHAGDMAGAVAAYHRERALSNELFETQRQKAIWELQGKYEAEKKQRQIQLLRRENDVKSAEIDNRRLQQRVWWLLALVFALASVIVGILYRKVRHANAQLKVKNLELKQQSSRDPLTSLYNRRHFQEFMRTHLNIDKRGSAAAGEEMVGALFLIDVDHFKHVNDGFGHAAGDAVLKVISDSLRVILRETDMIVRWGGEEFLAFLPSIPRSGLEEIARRLLSGISAQTVVHQGSKISVNVSIGFAPFPLIPGDRPLSWERAVNLVDMALYLAKSHGRNRAYGVRGFANFEQTSIEEIEHNLEKAWRDGFVDLAVVLGDTSVAPELSEALA